MDGVITRCFDHDDYKANVQLKAASAKNSLTEYVRDISYTIRVMCSHIRIKFEQYSTPENAKKSRDPQELLEIYGHIKADKKPTHRCGFLNFRDESDSEQSDDPPTVVLTEYSLAVDKVTKQKSPQPTMLYNKKRNRKTRKQQNR